MIERKTKNQGAIGAALSIAAACALALACAPAALAAPTPGASDDTAFSNNSGSTDVKVATDAGQLSATVPLNMTVEANPAGGALTGVPSASAYQVTNNSFFKIYVTDVKATAATGWAYSNADLTTTSASSATVGDIHLAVTPDGGAKLDVTAVGGDKPNWEVAAATSSGAATKDLAVTGSTSPLKKSIGDTGEKAVTLTYTIAAAQAS